MTLMSRYRVTAASPPLSDYLIMVRYNVWVVGALPGAFSLLWPELNKMAFWGGRCGTPGWRLRSISHEDYLVRIDMTNEERDILIRWKKRSDTLQACEN